MTPHKPKERHAPKGDHDEEGGNQPHFMAGAWQSICSRIFDGNDYARLSPIDKLVFLTLRLGPQVNVPCIFLHSVDMTSKRTGLRASEITKSLSRLQVEGWIATEGSEARGKKNGARCKTTLVWIIDGFRWHPYVPARGKETGRKHLEGIKKAILALPRSKLVATFIAYYDLPIPYPEAPDTQLLKVIEDRKRDSLSHTLCDRVPETPSDRVPETLPHRVPDTPSIGSPAKKKEVSSKKEEVPSKEVFPDKADPPPARAEGAPLVLPSKDEIENCPIDSICDWCREIAADLKPTWPKSFSFFTKHVREGRNKRAILLALKQIHQNRPTGDLWGYATQILNVEEGNFNERENHRNKEAHHHDPAKGGD